MASIHHTPQYFEKQRKLIESKTKLCTKCNMEKEKSFFAVSRQHIDGRCPVCKECRATANRTAYAKNPETFKQSVKKWIAKNPEKNLAHVHLNYELNMGRVSKPVSCEFCGEDKPLEAHHWKGYEKEHWLDVQWLCRPCHKKADMKM